MSYYNTNKEKYEVLDRSQKKTERQANVILNFFESNPNKLYTPFEVKDTLRLACPITSVRRAITDLENKNKLVKTNLMRQGIYGKQNHTWKLFIPEEERQLSLGI